MFFKVAFLLCISIAIWGYGVLSAKLDLFPYPQAQALFRDVRANFDVVMEEFAPEWYYINVPVRQSNVEIHEPGSVTSSLIFITGIKSDNELMARVIDNEGKTIHDWDIDWFRVWPNATHLSDDVLPKRKPGTLIHGAMVLPGGDIVFNYNKLGLVRLDACGNVRWRLPVRTHHTLTMDREGNFWTAGRVTHREADPEFVNFAPPFEEELVVQVSPEGKVLFEMSVFDILERNDLVGLFYLSSIENMETTVSGDIFHLNDVEPYNFENSSGLFDENSIMISIRNINAIVVFDKETFDIQYMSIGKFLRAHDPDFISETKISLFDNNNTMPLGKNNFSRIIEIDTEDNSVYERFKGTSEVPFFTSIIGNHQSLKNDNVLIVESTQGRVFEIDGQSEIVWEYFNTVADDVLGVVSDAQRLSPDFDRSYFENVRSQCQSPANASSG